MTASIIQYVVPRQQAGGYKTRVHWGGRTCLGWQSSRARRGNGLWRQYGNRAQRGSVNHATITVIFGLAALVFVGVLAFFYLQQVVDTASQGKDVRSLESQIIELKERQKELELEGAQLRSLQAVQDRVDKLNLIQTEQVAYLAPVPDRVARAGGLF